MSRRHRDEDDLEGMHEDDVHEHGTPEHSGHGDEEDPLDAYMAGIEAEVRATELRDGQRRGAAPRPAAPAAEPSDDSSGDEAPDQLDTAEGILALAQKAARRRDLGLVDHAAEAYEPFRKDFYIEAPAVGQLSEAEVAAYRQELDGIRIRGVRCPRPVQKWTQCGLDVRVLETVRRAGYERPTPIQAQSIPAIMAGRDIIGIAKTGSGKTVAFLLPMLRHVLDQRPLAPTEGPVVLVMTPTRELAMQIYVECHRFARPLGLRAVCACGGANIKEQIADLKRGAEILICTPGRLIELLVANSGRVTNLRRVTYFVLDEADRMFDMGFGPQVLKVVANIRPDKQAVLFSATFPKQMEALARKVLVRPLEIVVGDRSVVCDDVAQHVEVLGEEAKFVRLLEILGVWYPARVSRVLVFVDKQDAADNLLKDLLRRGYPCLSIHGGKDQADRDSAIEDFKAGVAPLLVATSVAARGLDVKDLGLVINYECPNHMEDYVHRVGRTGRAGSKGTAFTFVTPAQPAYASEIARALRGSHVDVPPALQRLVQEHEDRVRDGRADKISSGFGGKGLERIDSEHVRARKAQKRAAMGDDASDDDEDDLEQHVEKLISTGTAAPGGPAAAQQAPAASAGPPAPKKGPAPLELLELQRRLNAKIAEKTGAVLTNANAVADINRRYGSMSSDGSAPKPGDIVPIYDLQLAAVGAPEVQPKGYYCEIEINEFPQLVRFRMTHKDTIGQLQEYSGAHCIIRGEYLAPGRVAERGQRKLHIRLDAERQQAIEKARAEVKRLLVQFSTETTTRDFSQYEL